MNNELENQAHQDLLNEKYEHLSKLVFIADQLNRSNKPISAQTIQDAVDFFDKNMK